MESLIRELPEHLRERTRLANPQSRPYTTGDSILYWMCTAVRLEENPALDVARYFASTLKKPLLIYHGLSETYEYASDRHQTFILEAARDVQQQALDADLSYVFHLQTHADRKQHLVSLANQSAVVITEDMPVAPPRRFLSGLLQRSQTPVVLVDTACVAPMQLVGRAYDRAFQFREATDHLYRERILRPWPLATTKGEKFDTNQLPFAGVDFERQSIADLVASCCIDHGIGPIRDTRGGSTAGYERWRAFQKSGLRSYANRRNDALIDGVSRMSAYLHYGMVSPLRLAREARSANNSGAQKYLDELLIWRELAYVYCRYANSFDSLSAIPGWARQTLTEHQNDPRPALYDWETLARGQTNDELWNAAQRSLLRHGELHNNLRMTWGKAILQWTRTPQEALRLLIDLNHRYALDGRDPASYGGILWCLGQFDRPFQPAQPILGTVRSRPTSEHATRLNPTLFAQRVGASRTRSSRKVAVVGAGMSGAIAARTLADHGVEVVVFEKSRGVGGRMANRRTESGLTFDHGAQYFTARDPRFQRYVQAWLDQGLVRHWPDLKGDPPQRIAVVRQGKIASWSDDQVRYVAQPSMNSICHHLMKGISLQTDTQVERISKVNDKLLLRDTQGRELGAFDRLVVSAPAPQSVTLLEAVSTMAKLFCGITMQPCWAVMAEFPDSLTTQWVGAFVHDSSISWIARNSTKPGRREKTPSNNECVQSHVQSAKSVIHSETVLIHLDPEWTRANWDTPAESVIEQGIAELFQALSLEPQKPIHTSAHRWKYASVSPSEPLQQCFDQQAGIAICGDWTHGSRVEGAFLSGQAAAGRILGSFDESTAKQGVQQLLLFE